MTTNKNFKIISFLFYLIFIPAIPNSYIQANLAIKKKRWKEMQEKIDKIKPDSIDEGIKPLVIVLNLLGFETTGSCQGHIDKCLEAPYIDLTKTVSQDKLFIIDKKIKQKEDEIIQKSGLSLDEALKLSVHSDLKKLYDKFRKIFDTKENETDKQFQSLEKLFILLNGFYKKRCKDYDKMIIIEKIGSIDSARLYSHGAKFQRIRTKDQIIKKLKEYQEEMKLFTDYLIEYYYNTFTIS